MFLTMFPFTEYFQERKEDLKVHLNVDMLVLTRLFQKVNNGQIRFGTLFPDVVRYCGQYRGVNAAPFSSTDGFKTLLMFVYQSMANFSDLGGNETVELKPFWTYITSKKEREHWHSAVRDFGSTLIGFQNSEVSGGMEEDSIMNPI